MLGMKRRLGGWWRTWMVLTAIWFLLILGDIRGGNFGTRPTAKSLDLDGVLSRTYLGAHPDTASVLDLERSYPSWKIIDSLRSVAESNASSGDPFVSALRIRTAAAQREWMARVARTALTAPFLLLLLGLSVSWILRGFRPRDAAT